MKQIADGTNSASAGAACAADLQDSRAALAGDGGAFSRLVQRYEPDIARQMWRFSRDRTVLAELVQDTFVEAYFSLRGYRGASPFLHWLRRIATRVGYRYWKRQRRQRGNVPLDGFDDSDEGRGEPTPSDAADLLYALLARLAPPHRLVLSLMYFEECSVREIADRTGWNHAVVKMRALRARHQLRRIMERENLVEALR